MAKSPLFSFFSGEREELVSQGFPLPLLGC